jgi:hypothetical protein
MPLEVHQETGFLIMCQVLTTHRFVWYYRTVYKNETYVEFKEKKTGCGTHCTELIWRSERPQENRNICLNNPVHTDLNMLLIVSGAVLECKLEIIHANY